MGVGALCDVNEETFYMEGKRDVPFQNCFLEREKFAVRRRALSVRIWVCVFDDVDPLLSNRGGSSTLKQC